MVKREELKRMREMGRPGMDGEKDVVMDEIEGVAATSTTQEHAPKAASSQSKSKNTTRQTKLPLRQKVVIAADKTVGFVLGNTVGRVARFASRRILGQVPEEAKTSSFFVDDVIVEQATPLNDRDSSLAELEEDTAILQQAIADQLRKDASIHIDEEDEALFAELYKETQSNAAAQVATTTTVESQ
jgi:hypothetical protein